MMVNRETNKNTGEPEKLQKLRDKIKFIKRELNTIVENYNKLRDTINELSSVLQESVDECLQKTCIKENADILNEAVLLLLYLIANLPLALEKYLKSSQNKLRHETEVSRHSRSREEDLSNLISN